MITKLGGSEEVAEICGNYSRSRGAECAIILGLDDDGNLLTIGGNAFPVSVPDDFGDQVIEAISRINRGEGLQS